ncbi:MAG: GTP 3',8-cyclase MoaA [Thermoprotei archaeon]
MPANDISQLPTGVLIDRWGRPVTGVRISLNSSERCNYRCIFCHSEGIYDDPEDLMTPKEIERIVRILYKFGVMTVKLTGGEPMLRKDIVEIVRRIKSIGVKEVSMTTNGTRFALLAKDLKNAGLDRVNISVHSLRRDTYKFITGVDRFDEMRNAIDAALENQIVPLKLNVVIMRGVNENEITDLIDFTSKLNERGETVLQLIELVAEGSAANSPFFKKYYYSLSEIERTIAKQAIKVEKRQLHNRMKYYLPNGAILEFVKPMHNSEFCMGNNRIRITYDGKFKPCLLRQDNHVDFITVMRNGATDEELEEIFKKAVRMREPFFKPGIGPTTTPPSRIFYTCTE